MDQVNALKSEHEKQRDEDRIFYERSLDSLKAERDEEKRSYEKELFSVSEKNRLLEDSKLQLLHACEKERDRSLKKELLSVREENRIREDSKVELQHAREEAAELRNHIKEADMQPTIEKIVNLLPTELRAEIKKTSSNNSSKDNANWEFPIRE